MSGTPTLYGRGLGGQYLYGFAPKGGGNSPNYPVVATILFNTTGITLKWANAGPGTYNAWRVEVSLFPDFSTIFQTSNVTDNNVTFTDAQTNGARRYWRYRGSADGGTTFGRYSRVASYWVDTTAAASISISRTSWMLINPSTVTDNYVFQMFPFYRTMPVMQYRTRSRNRLGTLLSEYITIKAQVDFSFDNTRWLSPTEFSEVRRFSETVKTFYLAMFHDYEFGEPVPNIWKVQYVSDPDLAMFTAGRQDLIIGNLSFTEV